nr:MAG: primosomal protein N' [Bacillota bacterium]
MSQRPQAIQARLWSDGEVRYGEVAVDLAAAGADRLFTYAFPPDLDLVPGTWVEVPFHSRKLIGCYIGPAPAPPGVQVRPIAGVVAELPPLPRDLIDLARWVADRYLCTFAAALRLCIPAGARRRRVRERAVAAVALAAPRAEVAAAVEAAERRRAHLQARVLAMLLERPGPVPLAEVAARLGDHARAALRPLLDRGLIRRVTLTARRDPFGGRAAPPDAERSLTPAQREALAAVERALADDNPFSPRRPILIHGVTGSGKTVVYLQAIARVLARGQQAIVLVPEISLTPQTVGRFRARFGDRVAVLHSALSEGERWDEWLRIRRGEVDIVVGARSAVFAPVERLGMIIVDEEHESTYKQETTPPYHAREVAEERCRRAGAVLVLGSATPAVETYWRAERGEIERVVLPERVDGRPLPPVELVDMREELRAFNRSIFSRRLQEALDETLGRGEQAILFLNRRGYHTFVLCRACGEAIACPNCAVALTCHLPGPGQPQPRRLECHYCGHAEPVPSTCPRCGSDKIRYLGAGTERVEAELRELFPRARVLRLDVDTTRRKGAHGEILGAFSRGEADVLIGTQMVAKGLDFGRVTLVGVVLADTTANLPDFRAAERTFQLITQVAGRAGRGDRPGRALVQTYMPDHPAIAAAVRGDIAGFYARELAWRQVQGYPPFADFVRLLFTGPEEGEVALAARAAYQALLPYGKDGAMEVREPGPAPLVRLRGQWRYHLLLRGPDRQAMVAAVRAALVGRRLPGKGVRMSVDVGPYTIL